MAANPLVRQAPAPETRSNPFTSGPPSLYGVGPGPGEYDPFVDPTSNRGFNPANVLPTSPPGDVPIGPPQPNADTATRQAFLPQELMSPFYNAQGVNANVGTLLAGNMPAITDFIGQTMDPNRLTDMEQTFMDTSYQDAQEMMQNLLVQQEGQFRNTPMSSALPEVQGQIMDRMNRGLLNVGSQLALQRQQLASRLAPMNISALNQAIDYGPRMSERLFNLANQAYNAPYQIPLNIYSQLPFNAPTLVQTNQGSGKV